MIEPTRLRLELQGESLEAIALGSADGVPIVLQHGFPDVPASWLGVMRRLADAGYRAVAPWLRGYRPSSVSGPFDVDRLAADLLAWGAHLGGGAPVALVGHDWGAVATHIACLRAPERVAWASAISVPHPLTMLSASGPSQLVRSRYIGFFQLPILPERALRQGFVRELWARWSPTFSADESHLAEVERVVRSSLPGPLGPYRALTRPLAPAAARLWAARDARTDVPTLYLHGDVDACIHPSSARGQARRYTGRFVARTLAGGHFLPLEAPDALADALLAFAA